MSQALQHRPPRHRLLRPEGRAPGRWCCGAWCAISTSTCDLRDPADGARRRRPRALLPQCVPVARGARQGARSPAGARPGRSAYAQGRDPVAAARAALNGLEPDYVELLDLDGTTVLAAAARVGSTRLIDNVILDKERPGDDPPTQACSEHARARQAPPPRAGAAQTARREDRDGHGVRRAERAPRRRGRRRHDPRRRLRRHGRARLRLDRAGVDGRDGHAHARGHARSSTAARDRRHAVRLVPGLGRGRAAERGPLRQGSGCRRGQARGREARRSHACARSSAPASR